MVRQQLKQHYGYKIASLISVVVVLLKSELRIVILLPVIVASVRYCCYESCRINMYSGCFLVVVVLN